MVKRITVVLALAALMTTASAALSAQEKEVKVVVTAGEGGPSACAAAKELTPGQMEKVEKLREEHRLRAVELRADLTKLGVELKRETDKPEPNMGAVEATLKKMSSVRERIQMSRIEHRLAMRKLLGDDCMAHMRRGSGDRDMTWIEAEAEEGDEPGEREVRIMRFKDRDGAGMPPGCGGGRLDRMKARGRGMKAACDPGSCGMMMHREGSAPGACCAPREGHICIMRRAGRDRSCDGSCSMHKGNWESRMFRPRGKRTAHRCSEDCRIMEWKERMPAERR